MLKKSEGSWWRLFFDFFPFNFVHFDWLILPVADESLYLMAKRLCDTHFIKFV